MSRCTLGTSALSSWGGHDIASGVEVVRAALELGITAVDTAPAYANGEAEEVVGRALDGCRDEVVVMTKFPDPHAGEAPPPVDEIPWMLEASLHRLGTDHVDLYQLHDHQAGWPVDDVLAVLHDLVKAGSIRAIGTTRLRPEELVEPSGRRSGPVGTRSGPRRLPTPCWSARPNAVSSPLARPTGSGSWPTRPTTGAGCPGATGPTCRLRRTRGHGPGRSGRTATTVSGQRCVRSSKPWTPSRRSPPTPTSTCRPSRWPGCSPIPVSTRSSWAPRTVEHLAVVPAALEIHLPSDLLARVDELVPPGTTVDPLDLPTYLAEARRSRALPLTSGGPS